MIDVVSLGLLYPYLLTYGHAYDLDLSRQTLRRFIIMTLKDPEGKPAIRKESKESNQAKNR